MPTFTPLWSTARRAHDHTRARGAIARNVVMAPQIAPRAALTPAGGGLSQTRPLRDAAQHAAAARSAAHVCCHQEGSLCDTQCDNIADYCTCSARGNHTIMRAIATVRCVPAGCHTHGCIPALHATAPAPGRQAVLARHTRHHMHAGTRRSGCFVSPRCDYWA